MLKVDSISRGLVIDHIASGKGIKIYEKLKLAELNCSTVLLMNVPSSKLEKKDIIKIENMLDVDLTMLGLIDPNITVNVIENSVITNKLEVKIPEEIQGMFKCKNPRCISNFDDYAAPQFKLAHINGKIKYRCSYCEELTSYTI